MFGAETGSGLTDGVKVDRYVVERLIGEDPVGRSWRVWDAVAAESVLLVELRPLDLPAGGEGTAGRPARRAPDAETLRRFVAKARRLMLMTTPDRLPVQRVFSARGTAFVILPDHATAPGAGTLMEAPVALTGTRARLAPTLALLWLTVLAIALVTVILGTFPSL